MSKYTKQILRQFLMPSVVFLHAASNEVSDQKVKRSELPIYPESSKCHTKNQISNEPDSDGLLFKGISSARKEITGYYDTYKKCKDDITDQASKGTAKVMDKKGCVEGEQGSCGGVPPFTSNIPIDFSGHPCCTGRMHYPRKFSQPACEKSIEKGSGEGNKDIVESPCIKNSQTNNKEKKQKKCCTPIIKKEVEKKPGPKKYPCPPNSSKKEKEN